MAYYRENKNQRMLVAANFGQEAAELKLEYPVKRVVLSNQKDVEMPEQMLKLERCEVIVLELNTEK